MFLRKLFAGRARPGRDPAPFSADLGGDDDARVSAALRECLARTGGERATAQRAAGLVRLFIRLSPDGRARFAHILDEMNETDAVDAMSRYSRIEEAELFGRPSSKLAIFDAFEPPRRRLLLHFRDAPGGDAMLTALRDISTGGLAGDIADVLAEP